MTRGEASAAKGSAGSYYFNYLSVLYSAIKLCQIIYTVLTEQYSPIPIILRQVCVLSVHTPVL